MSTYIVTVNGTAYTAVIRERRGDTLSFQIAGEEYSVRVARAWQPSTAQPRPGTQVPPTAAPVSAGQSSPHEVKAPIPGIVSEIKTAPGETVQAGTTLLVIEAMKMENPIKAIRAGIVEAILVKKGQEVGNGALLVSFKRDD